VILIAIFDVSKQLYIADTTTHSFDNILKTTKIHFCVYVSISHMHHTIPASPSDMHALEYDE